LKRRGRRNLTAVGEKCICMTLTVGGHGLISAQLLQGGENEA
jgi:hypothetical protein